jgi:peptidoglycan-associated lipoprotein
MYLVVNQLVKGEKGMKKRMVLVGIIGLIVCFSMLFVTGCAKDKTIITKGGESAATEESAAAAEKAKTVDVKAKEAAAKKEQLAKETAASEQAAKAAETPLTEGAASAVAAEGAAKVKALSAKEEKIFADIRFDFDKYNLMPEAREILKGQAEWLAKNKDYRLVIEGNCDERGTTEYNLALGERRASEAMKYLVELGIDGSRIKTISYGKEMPLDPGHNEEAWAKNRRDHFVITSKK